ncbi:MAG: biotin synthase BioB [Myxococcales bacterium]|nr:biotin synthase BioB [Myxococcales bacterium]
MSDLRHDWSRDEVRALFELPFPELSRLAQNVHAAHHDPTKVQLATLSNIKTGGCPEDCSYCPQAARYHTGVEASELLEVRQVVAQAEIAKANGASRFCMGAAWRRVKDGRQFDRVVEMVRAISDLDLEVCVTLGMIDEDQVQRLADAGLHAYNHNLDTSPEHYDQIISTRTYDDRLQTLDNVRKAGVTVCCGGIVGLGETRDDRIGLLATLACLKPHPESVPINQLVRAPGTPLESGDDIDLFEYLRTIAVARILMPASMVRLAAGRTGLSREGQALAFLLGANSIFYGERLLTTPNPDADDDRALLDDLGLTPLEAAPRRVPSPAK